MATVIGFVNDIGIDSEDASHIWFSLEQLPDSGEWIKVDEHRAWFRVDVTGNRPEISSPVRLFQAARRNKTMILLEYGEPLPLTQVEENDCFTVQSLRPVAAAWHDQMLQFRY